MIDNRKDILLLLLYSPGHGDAPNEPIVGRTRLVKMLFLFKMELLPALERDRGIQITDDNFYEFFPWDFGPFSTEVYDDINFFLLRGFIASNASTGDPLPESAAEWHKWLSAVNDDPDSNEATEYQEEEFVLTERGAEFASRLYKELSSSQKAALRMFKKKLATAVLRGVLRYVYKQYPEYTTASKIKADVLGDYVA